MASKIRVLPEDVINKIAAGEVIENPASVVKELVDNALDAGAIEIVVEILGGGRQLIRVSDNGSGMNRDDALLCLERHGTSKIRSTDDLSILSTLGFRGEALPSIASISKMLLLTALQPEGDKAPNEEGTMVVVEGGKLLHCAPAARNPGTTIEVKSLFFNVPVRRKFQKSPAYDSQEVFRMLSVLSLAKPHAMFKLISDHKTLLSTQSLSSGSFQEQLNQKIRDVLGEDFFEESVPLDLHHEVYHLEGRIGKPSFNRQNRTGHYLFINDRPVTSPLIAHAIRQGYGTTLPAGRYPVFCLHLHMPADLVDVNVHPQKKEVRLRQELSLKQWITQAVFKALQLPFSIEDTTDPHVPFLMPEKFAAFSMETPFVAPFSPPSPEFSISLPLPPPKPVESRPSFPTASQQTFDVPVKETIFRILGTIEGYILLEKEGWWLVDQRRVHARIQFEKIKAQHPSSSKGRSHASQGLLIPFSFDVSLQEAGLIRQYLDSLQKLQFHVQEFGPQTFLVEAVPKFVKIEDLKDLILQIVDEIHHFSGEGTTSQQQEKHWGQLANRLSLSSKIRLSMDEARELMHQLFDCEVTEFCPQGKPVKVLLDSKRCTQIFEKI